MFVVSLIRKYTFITQFPSRVLHEPHCIPIPLRLQQLPLLQQWRHGHSRSDKWLPWEDELLRNYVKHNGKKWNEFVQHCLPNRCPKQCQVRWTDVLNPVLKRGPFSAEEKNLVETGVATLGQGQWTKISLAYLPHRSPRRIANEWSTINATARRNNDSGNNSSKSWTKEEDELVLKGVTQFGERAWTKIAKRYLPWRNRVQIRNHYRSQLDAAVKKEEWTQQELDLLLRRVIVYGQDWNKVAEGLPGRTPEKCSSIWMTELDPAMDKGPWREEETRLFWERVNEYRGNFVKVAEGLPGRNRLDCFKKFWSTVRQDIEFTLVYGDTLKKMKSENGPQWRTRIAKLVIDWITRNTSIRQSANNSIQIHQAGSWTEQDLLQLDQLVVATRQLDKKDILEYSDWKKIAKQFNGRDAHQCKYQYDQHLSMKNVTSKGSNWTLEEDKLLIDLVENYGTIDWNQIAIKMPNRNKIQCAYRWHRVLKFHNQFITRHKKLTDTEKSLVKEGVQMFGSDWNAIRMTYLQNRTPEQLMRWYHQYSEEKGPRSAWTKDEDKILQFAINKYKKEYGEVQSWSQISKMIQGRTPKQCKSRWLYTLNPTIAKKGPWTHEEEMQLLEIVHKYKMQKGKTSMWPLVAKELNTGRTDWACRSKYNYMQHKGHRFA